ncbi:MAG: DUF4352 domain-containing protein [Clostridia bacterium]|nr:DUF4352 domain-containing protein [Clostridia bacterium]
MKLTLKAKRNIGLVVLTLVLIVAIILIVYFVQKSDSESKLKTGAVGQTVSTSQADVCVKELRVAQSVGEVEANDGKCFLLVRVEITANKKIKASSVDFEVKDGVNVTNGYTSHNGHSFMVDAIEYTLKKGESETFDLIFEVESERAESYYLYAFGARIDLGGTISNILQ